MCHKLDSSIYGVKVPTGPFIFTNVKGPHQRMLVMAWLILMIPCIKVSYAIRWMTWLNC